MLKKLIFMIFIMSLTGCYISYDQKHDDNVNYYTDYLDDNGIVDYEQEAVPTSANQVETVYKMHGIDDQCNSRNIRVYYGTEEATGKAVTVYMPDRVGEPNVITYDIRYDLDYLKEMVEFYNNSDSTEDISLDEEQIRQRFVSILWGGLIINDVRQEIDEETIQEFVFDNLSNPIIFRIGIIREAINSKQVYFGLNQDNEYVFFSQSHDHNTLEILFTYEQQPEETVEDQVEDPVDDPIDCEDGYVLEGEECVLEVLDIEYDEPTLTISNITDWLK